MISYSNQHKYVTRGDVALTNNYEYCHVETAGDEWQFCFINFTGNSVEEYEKLWNRGSFNISQVENIKEYSDYFVLTKQNVNQGFPLSEIQNSAYITQLLTIGLFSLENKIKVIPSVYLPEWIIAVKQYIDNNISDDIKISDLASRFYMERTYFSRKFKQYTGKTPKEFQIDRRLEEGVRLMMVRYWLKSILKLYYLHRLRIPLPIRMQHQLLFQHRQNPR